MQVDKETKKLAEAARKWATSDEGIQALHDAINKAKEISEETRKSQSMSNYNNCEYYR